MSLLFAMFGLCWHDWRIRTIICENYNGDYVNVEVQFCINHDCGVKRVKSIILR